MRSGKTTPGACEISSTQVVLIMTPVSHRAMKQGLTISRQPIRIGCAGWNIPRNLAGSFVSAGTHLERYALTFNSCEINSSFYRPHERKTWERWARTVPADFRFSVKAPRAITHRAKLSCSRETL